MQYQPWTKVADFSSCLNLASIVAEPKVLIGKPTLLLDLVSYSCYTKQPTLPIYTSTSITRFEFWFMDYLQPGFTSQIISDSQFLLQWTRCLTTSLMHLVPMTVRVKVTLVRL